MNKLGDKGMKEKLKGIPEDIIHTILNHQKKTKHIIIMLRKVWRTTRMKNPANTIKKVDNLVG